MSGGVDREVRVRDGARIALTVHDGPRGDAARVVLIHPLAADRSAWAGVADRLSGRASLLAYDCRGHGRSEKRREQYSVEQFADDLADMMDALGWRDAVVTGCSMGGCVAQAFAARHPQRLAGLALIDTTAWYGPEAPATWKARGEKGRAEGMASLVVFQHERWFSPKFRAERPDAVAAATATFVANDTECYAQTCEMLGAADLRAALPSIRVPTTVIVGEDDYATPVASARHLADAIPNARLVVLPGVRHLTPIEAPGPIADELLALAATAKG